MFIIKTRTGKQFDSDYLTETEDPDRLYTNIINAPVSTVATTFTDPDELPIEGHPEYTAFSSLNVTKVGVSICLKKGSA